MILAIALAFSRTIVNPMEAPFRFPLQNLGDLEKLLGALNASPDLVPGSLRLTEGLDLLAEQFTAEGRRKLPGDMVRLFRALWRRPLQTQRPRFLRLEAQVRERLEADNADLKDEALREFERLLPGAAEAVHRLNDAAIPAVVATNQSGIGRGLFDMATLNAIHAEMHRVVGELMYFAPVSLSVLPPKPMTLPVTSVIGNIKRLQNLSWLPPVARPPCWTRSSGTFPAMAALTRPSTALGATPSRHLLTLSCEIFRWARYSRATLPFSGSLRLC